MSTGDPATYGGVPFFYNPAKNFEREADIFFKGLLSAMSNCTDVTLYNIRTDTYSQLGKPILFLFNSSHLHQALAKVYFYVKL
jgi:hypothetical protein